MILNENDGIRWFCDIGDTAPEYTPVKCTSILSFYTLKGRTSTITKDNIVPIENLNYCVHAKSENRYYLHEFRCYPLDVLYFINTDKEEDLAVANLRRYVSDGTIWILYTPEQIKATTELLIRLYKANLNGEGKLDYRIYLKLLESILEYEDYKDYGKSLVGTKTVQNQMQCAISELWKQASELKK